MDWSPGRCVSRIFRKCQLDLDRAFAHTGLGKGLYLPLVELSRGEGVNQKALAERLVMDQASVTRSVRKLMVSGYVERKDDPQDGRAHILFLTQKGWSLLVEVQEKLDKWDLGATKGLSEQELGVFRELLRKMESNVMKQNYPK
jgi:DNA-binding MarR family transcriptional regulator